MIPSVSGRSFTARAAAWKVPDTPRLPMTSRPPWLAARIEAGAPLMPPRDLLWMAKFERAMGWAWLELEAHYQPSA